ncbi:GTPase IMAP family member GIMD1-like [Anableps anableps]
MGRCGSEHYFVCFHTTNPYRALHGPPSAVRPRDNDNTFLCRPDQEAGLWLLLLQSYKKMDDKHRFRENILSRLITTTDEQRDVLVLNVLLLGDRQSGRSSVGNALIGGDEFQTGTCVSGVSMTTELRVLSRKFPAYFRRQGAESDLVLRILDTPPMKPRPHNLQELCPEGVHVLVVVVRVDQLNENSQLLHHTESLFGPEWRHHAMLVFTHADHLEKAGLQPSVYLTQRCDWLSSLAEEVGGGVSFLDNSSDWPSIRGRPLREQVLRLSAKNHHKALKFRSDQSL